MGAGADYKIQSDIVFTSYNVKAQVDNIIAQLARIPKQIGVGINTGMGGKGGTSSGGPKPMSSYKQAQIDIQKLSALQKSYYGGQEAAARINKTNAAREAATDKANAAAKTTAHKNNTDALLRQLKVQKAMAKIALDNMQIQKQANAMQVAQAGKLSKRQGAPQDYSKAAQQFKLFRAGINDANGELAKLGFQAAVTAKRFLAFVGVSALFIGITNAIRTAIVSSVEYEKQFAKISQVTGTSIKDLGELDKEITRLATSFGVSSASITTVALTLAQAGLNARETKTALDVLAKTELAATFGDIKNTTEGAIAIMAQFKTGAADLAAQLGAVNSVSAKFAVESEDLVEVIRKSGGAFQATGGELNELLALFTSVRSTTRESAESISTGLRTIFTRLQRNRTVNFLGQLGVDLRDTKGEFIGIYPAIEKLSVALKSLSGTDPRFSQIVEELGGFRQVSKVIPLLQQFETSQKALSVARRAGTSIDKDAAIAQLTLANRFVKVKEEFLALSRAYYNDGGLRSFIGYTLQAASALLKVVDAIRPLIPLIGAIGTIKLVGAFGKIGQGAALQHHTYPIAKAAGGVVPGTGNGDTVPANLTPGEFVIKKSAVQAFGAENLHKINRYASGGKVAMPGWESIETSNPRLKITPKVIKRVLEGFQKRTGIDPSGLVHRFDINRSENVGKTKGHFKTVGEGAVPHKSIGIYEKNIDSYKTLKRTIYHELGHAIDNKGFRKSTGQTFRSNTEGHIDNSIAQSFLRNIELKNLAVSRPSPKYRKYRTSNEELFANGFAHRYVDRPNPKFLKETSNYFNSIEQAIPNFIKQNVFTGRPAGGISSLLPRGYTNIGPKVRRAARFAAGGLVGKYAGLTKYEAFKKWFKGDGPGFLADAKTLLSGVSRTPGAKSSRFLAFQDSLGISRRNSIFGTGSLNRPNIGRTAENILLGGNLYNPNNFVRRRRGRPTAPVQPDTIPMGPSGPSGPSLLSKAYNASRNAASGVLSGGRYIGNKLGVGALSLRNTKLPRLPKLPEFSNPFGSVVNQKNINKVISDIEKEYGIKFNKDFIPKINITKGDTPIGTYHPESQDISLNKRKIKSKYNLKEILVHELGHRADQYLDPTRKNYSTNIGYKRKGRSDFRAFEAHVNSGEELSPSHKFAKAELNAIRGAFKAGKIDSKTLKYLRAPNELFAESFRKFITKNAHRLKSPTTFRGDRDEFAEKILGQISTKKFATGGFVGGSGNSDTVPSLLTPGEVVINKKSAKAFGYHNLNKINKYATGGIVNPSALGLGLAFGPSVSSGLFGDKNENAKAITSGLTAAAGALLIFALAVKTNTEKYTTAMVLAEDKLGAVTEDLAKNRAEYEKIQNEAKQQFEVDKQTLQGRISSGTNNAVPGNPLTRDAQEAKQELAEREKLYNESYKAEKDKYKKIKDKNKEEKELLETEYKKEEASIKTADAFNKATQTVAMFSAGLLAAGTIITSYTDMLAAKGDRRGYTGAGTSNEAGAGGALSTGAVWALGGAYIGGKLGGMVGAPGLGAVIGGGAGFIGGAGKGFYDKSTETERVLNAFDIKKSFETLEQTLSNISKGKTTVKDSRFAVGQSLKEIDTNFFKLSGEDFETFRGSVGNAIDGLDFIFRESLKTATSISDFNKENKDLINTLTRFGGYTIAELEKKITDEIEAKNKSIKVQEDLDSVIAESGRRLEATFAISSALSTAESSIHKFGDSLDRLSQIASGNFSDKSNFDFSTLSNIATANNGDLRSQSTQAAGFIGGPASGIAADITAANEIVNKLPGILNSLVLGQQLEGDDLLDSLKKELGGEKGFAAGLIIDAVKKEIGSTGDTVKFLEKFKQDPIGITKNIQNSVQPTADALAEATPRIIQQLDDFADGLAAARENFLASLGGLTKAIDIEQAGAEFNVASSGRPLSFAQESLFDTNRRNILTGGSDVGGLKSRLLSAQKGLESNSALRQSTSDSSEFKKLTEAISDNIKEISTSTNALEYLSDVNSRLATVEKERSRIQKDRVAKSNLAEGFVFGDSAAKQETVKGLIGVKTILQNLEAGKSGVSGLNNELKQSSLGILKQFADSPVFNGKTGQEIIDKVSQSEGFNTGIKADELDILAQGNIIIAEAKAAQEVLNAVSKTNNEAFLAGLGTKFDSFFVKLEQFFVEDSKKKEDARNNEKQARIEGIDTQIQQITAAKLAVGVKGDTPLDVVKNNLDVGIKLADSRSNIQKLQKKIALTNAGKSDTNLIDTSDIRSFVGGEAGNQLEKDINEIKTQNRSVAEANSAISKIIEKSLSSEITKEVLSSQELIKQLGVGDDIKQGFISGAKEAKLILDKAEVEKDIPELLKERRKITLGSPTGLASGGSVFGARGSDTVPAMTTDGRPYMLTPGEIVMNRRASGKFGGLLHQMNTGYLADGGSVLSKEEEYAKRRAQQEKDLIDVRNRNEEAKNRNSIKKSNIYWSNKANKNKLNRLYKKKWEEDWEGTDDEPSKSAMEFVNKIKANRTFTPSPGTYDPVMSPSWKKKLDMEKSDILREKELKQSAYLASGAKYAKMDKAKRTAYSTRAKELREQGVPGYAIRQTIGNENRQRIFEERQAQKAAKLNKGGQAFQSISDSGASPSGAQNVNPKLMEDFVRVMDKLSGSKLELQINGTLNININASNIEDSISKKFLPPIQEYVDNEISKAISKFASANGIQYVVTQGKKENK